MPSVAWKQCLAKCLLNVNEGILIYYLYSVNKKDKNLDLPPRRFQSNLRYVHIFHELKIVCKQGQSSYDDM